MYINIDERYGENVPVTIEDYKELDPEGEFKEDWAMYGDEWIRVIVEKRDGAEIIVAEWED